MKQCDRCGSLVSDCLDICEECCKEILREEEQNKRLAEENYDFEYGDYRY